jgi:light-regulated signal transduction histidine kinase (bacteriophytochrome)
VVASPSAVPAFGEADLSNCEREQIHLPASIQPHGALLVVRESDFTVVQASANAADFLGIGGGLIGKRLDAIAGNLASSIRPHLDDPLHTTPVAVRCRIGEPARAFDGLLHRPPVGGLIVELEQPGPTVDVSRTVESALQGVVALPSLRAVSDEAARLFRGFTGYDRVMVYRFDDDGHGEVISEQRRPDLESLLGNRYPATDIPQIARRLYERNRVRVLVDIEYTPVPLVPRLLPATGQDLDMSLCGLRSVSPIHVQYLRNMGVRGTLVASLMVGGRLWGLVACHHYTPCVVPFEVRAVCELLAEMVATRIAALESFSEGQAELSVRRLEQRMIEAISRDGDWRVALFDGTQALLQPLGAGGAALLYDGQVLTVGEVPGTQQLREIGAWLDTRPRAGVIATSAFTGEAPQFAALVAVAGGLLATPVSQSPGEYLVWFRPEQVRTVTWGGDPFKPMVIGANPSDLSPRRSFAQWHQLVEGTCEPWTKADVTAARLIGETVADVVLQFRSVRMLIAQDQLEQVGRQVKQSEQPVVIADASGRILLTNEAFQKLLPADRAPPAELEALLEFVAEPDEVRRRLWDLLRHRRTWRGEVRFDTGGGEPMPLLVRADPVFSSPDRVLGFVVLFTDLTGRKAADAARRRFQDGIVEGHRMTSGRLDSKAGLVFGTLLSAVLENAQLAALEITDGVEVARMPDMLESVQDSVRRATEVLEHLVRHASRAADPEG